MIIVRNRNYNPKQLQSWNGPSRAACPRTGRMPQAWPGARDPPVAAPRRGPGPVGLHTLGLCRSDGDRPGSQRRGNRAESPLQCWPGDLGGAPHLRTASWPQRGSAGAGPEARRPTRRLPPAAVPCPLSCPCPAHCPPAPSLVLPVHGSSPNRSHATPPAWEQLCHTRNRSGRR